MIGFMPDFYPDELVYSLLARYYQRSGYLAYIHAARDGSIIVHGAWMILYYPAARMTPLTGAIRTTRTPCRLA